ncbi:MULTISPECIES: TIGR04149 family rSAM-modified RiPP [Parabacteroides]|jgi:hypothetical protein|uniref:TIGR04149 family rSAM-modified RiPP n=1 Tax=Parabacteroides TaxID=375288 RepID=UPI000F0026A2|nr:MULTISPECIES: TIGR04149 family rSAM-modified RiPP [unclassified Parabacteroides]RHR35571.1 rSAM-modified peptide [Parabacteroides sp. AF18-52]RHR93634.1 rSAM-modified peptide [Parabacteroides sp. AF14-59]
MKTLGKLKLHEFRKAELEKRELNALKGACNCKCLCISSYTQVYILSNSSMNDASAY